MDVRAIAAVVAGAGRMGRWHADAVDRTGATLAAVADPDLDRARELAGRHRGAVAHPSLEAALEAVPADVLHICTPVGTHLDLAAGGLDRGLHVLVEKPLARDAAATRSLLERADEVGRIVCPVHQFLFQRGARRLFDRLDAIGPVRHVDFTACSAGAEQGGDRGAVAREILPHPLAFLERLAPGGLDGLAWEAGEAAPGEVRATARAPGFTASVLISMSGRPRQNRMQVVGEGGTARLDLYHGYGVVRPSGRPSRFRKAAAPFSWAGREAAAAARNLLLRAIEAQPAYPGLRELVRAFHRAAAGDGASPIPAGETLRVARAHDRLRGLLGETGDRGG